MITNEALNTNGNYYTVPNAILALGLSPGAIAVYNYLSFRECRRRGDKDRYTCHPSMATIGEAIGRSTRSVRGYVQELIEAGLILTEPTKVTTADGMRWNGNLKYTLLDPQRALFKVSTEVDMTNALIAGLGQLSEDELDDLRASSVKNVRALNGMTSLDKYISNIDLKEQYPNVQDNEPKTWRAFLRRIHKVVEYYADGTTTDQGNATDYVLQPAPDWVREIDAEQDELPL